MDRKWCFKKIHSAISRASGTNALILSFICGIWLLFRHPLLRAGQVWCNRRQKGISQIMKCCRVKSVESTDELWIPRSEPSPRIHLFVPFATHFADELSSFAFFFSWMLSRQPLSMQQQPYQHATDVAVESPKSRHHHHHHQEVRGRILSLVNVASFYNTTNLLSCNPSSQHQHAAHWDHDLE